MSWYNTGFKGVAEERERIAQSQAAEVDRFYMKTGAKAQVVFVDDDPFSFHEHQYFKNGDRDVLTCMSRVFPERPICCQKLGEKTAYLVGYMTVLDCTPYPGKKDPSKVWQYSLKLFPAKLGTLESLKRKREDLVSLVNRKCDVFRDEGKTAAVGNEFTFKEEIPTDKLEAMFNVSSFKGKKLADLFEEADRNPQAMQKLSLVFTLVKGDDGKLVRRLPVFNYAKILAPKNPDEVLRLLGGGNITSNYDEAKAQRGSGGMGSGGPVEGAPF
jgi:hypothetical protein